MKSIDVLLHTERMNMQKEKLYATAALSSLSDGTMVMLNSIDPACYLWYQQKLFQWKILGYAEPTIHATGTEVLIVTPPSNVTFARRYIPLVHSSAGA